METSQTKTVDVIIQCRWFWHVGYEIAHCQTPIVVSEKILWL